MQDAAGKGTYGVYIGMKHIMDPGKWDECNQLENAQYCLMKSGIPIPATSFEFPTVIGVCAPINCTEEALENTPYAEVSSFICFFAQIHIFSFKKVKRFSGIANLRENNRFPKKFNL